MDKIYLGNKSLYKVVNNNNRLIDPTYVYGKKAFGGKNCYLISNEDVGKIIGNNDCILGDFKNSRRRILVIGNSFSSAFINAFKEVTKENNSILLTSSWGASVVPLIPNKGEWQLSNEYYWNEVVPSLINRLREGDIVFIMSALEQFNKNDSDLELLEKGLREFSNLLSNQSLKLLFLHSLPSRFEDKNNNECGVVRGTKSWFNSSSSCKPIFKEKDTILKERSKLSKLLNKLEKENILVSVDLINIFCPEEFCTFTNKEGIFLYRDNVHPSVDAAELSSPLIKKSINKLTEKI